MSHIASCSRAAFNVVSRRWQSSAQRAAVLTGSRTIAAHFPRQHCRRPYSTSPTESNLPPSRGLDTHASSKLADHLNTVFSPLKFPPELANRILTHSSHRDAAVSNNTRLGFIGRRVLNSYLMLSLHSAPSLHASPDYEKITERALNTYVLGEHVAPKWDLGHVLKWSPVRSDPEVDLVDGDFSKLSPRATRTVGLYKVQGNAVEAVMGGIYHQFGGNLAHRVFHTRVLPHILLPGTPAGLNDAFHEHALELCERMGGLEGALVVENGASSGLDAHPVNVADSAIIP